MIYDVLNNKFDAGDRISFVGNNAVNEVAVRALTTPKEMINANAGENFVDGDNIQILKIKLIMPYQYVHSTGNIGIQLRWFQAAGGVAIPEIGGAGFIYLPKITELEPKNLFLNAPSPGSGNFTLQLVLLSMNVSQVNAPAVLNLVTMDVGLQLDIAHTLAMLP